MGHWFSKNTEVETETTFENNVTQIAGNVSLGDKEIIMMLLIICLIKVFEFSYMIYKLHRRNLKRGIIKNHQNI